MNEHVFFIQNLFCLQWNTYFYKTLQLSIEIEFFFSSRENYLKMRNCVQYNLCTNTEPSRILSFVYLSDGENFILHKYFFLKNVSYNQFYFYNTFRVYSRFFHLSDYVRIQIHLEKMRILWKEIKSIKTTYFFFFLFFCSLCFLFVFS